MGTHPDRSGAHLQPGRCAPSEKGRFESNFCYWRKRHLSQKEKKKNVKRRGRSLLKWRISSRKKKGKFSSQDLPGGSFQLKERVKSQEKTKKKKRG